MKDVNKLNILEYLDYRQFLIDYYYSKKSESSHFSYGVWSKKLDIKSTATLCKILTGAREPSSETIMKLTKYFDFSENETKHFLLIVKLHHFISNQELKKIRIETDGITITYH